MFSQNFTTEELRRAKAKMRASMSLQVAADSELRDQGITAADDLQGASNPRDLAKNLMRKQLAKMSIK